MDPFNLKSLRQEAEKKNDDIRLLIFDVADFEAGVRWEIHKFSSAAEGLVEGL